MTVEIIYQWREGNLQVEVYDAADQSSTPYFAIVRHLRPTKIFHMDWCVRGSQASTKDFAVQAARAALREAGRHASAKKVLTPEAILFRERVDAMVAAGEVTI